MKLKLLLNNEIIIEITVSSNRNRNCHRRGHCENRLYTAFRKKQYICFGTYLHNYWLDYFYTFQCKITE